MTEQHSRDQQLQRDSLKVKKIIDYITENGYVENVMDLVKAPFDKPDKFVKLFDAEKQKEIAQIVNSVKENATKIVGQKILHKPIDVL